MKKVLIGFLLIFITVVFTFQSEAQINIGINLNIGSGERYVYFPDHEFYYDNQSAMFIYISDGRWVRVKTLPVRYRNIDFYRVNKVVIRDYTDDRPYYYYKVHRSSFPKGKYKSSHGTYWSPKEYKQQTKSSNNKIQTGSGSGRTGIKESKSNKKVESSPGRSGSGNKKVEGSSGRGRSGNESKSGKGGRSR